MPLQQLGVQLVVQGQQQAGQALDQTGTKFERFQGRLKKAQLPANIAAAGVLAFAKAAGSAASDVEQAMGGVESVFGKNAATVEKWAKGAADSVGLAQDEYANAASKFGAQFKNMGLSQDKVLAGTDKMINLGADLSATFGGSTQDAVDALSAAFRGEADSAEKYGLNLSMTAVNAELAARGQDKLTGTALAAAKAQVVMDLATKQAGGSIGQFARESDTAAGAQQRASAQWSNAQANLGKGLLPIMQFAATVVAVLSRFMSENTGIVKILAIGILALTAAIKLFSSALIQSPIGRVIGLVALLATGIAVLWAKSETFRNIVLAVWNAVRAGAQAAFSIIRSIITGVFTAVTAIWRTLTGIFAAIWGAVRAAVQGAFAIIRGIIVGVFTAVTVAWRAITGFFSGLWSTVSGAVSSAWSGIGTAIGAVVGVVRGAWEGITGFFSGLWSTVTGVVSSAWSGIGTAIGAVVGVVRGAWDGIVGFFSGIWDRVTGVARRIWDNVAGAITSVIGVVKGAWDGITGFYSDLWNGIVGIVQGAVNGVLGAINSVVTAVQKAIEWVRQLASLTSINAQVMGQSFIGGSAMFIGAAGPVAYHSSPVTITVSGAGSPDDTARAIESVLRRRERRISGVRLG